MRFLRSEAGQGVWLGFMALLAVIWANSPGASAYFALVGMSLPVWTLGDWVKEGLMSLFFFQVGLEIKSEIRQGELSHWQSLALPVAAAIGGMIVPALVYLGVNATGGDPRGWPVPVATDIAFALAVFAAFGRGLPQGLRIFLLTLAIVDDLGAVLIIAGVFHSGIHLSLVAVVLAQVVPVKAIRKVMHWLHPPVAWIVLPAFAFTAAGVSLAGAGRSLWLDPRCLGVALGLLIGKPVGVYLGAHLAVRCKIARFPVDFPRLPFVGVCLLCGIGFTMSLFLGALAIPPGEKAAVIALKSGIAVGSILSACAGAAILFIGRRSRATGEPDRPAA